METWIPFLTGLIGAVVGAGASLGGIYLNTRAERQRRREEAAQAQQGARRQDVITAAKQAYAFLYELRRCMFNRDTTKLKSVDERWGPAATSLVALRVGTPHRDIAQLAVRVVTALDLAINVTDSWLKRVPITEGAEEGNQNYYKESDAWSFHDDALKAVDELVGRVRVVEQLEDEIPPESSRLAKSATMSQGGGQ